MAYGDADSRADVFNIFVYTLDSTMENYDLRLALIDGLPSFVTELAPPGHEQFSFQLCHHDEQFGNRSFDQWWMDIKTIYPTRNRVAKNFESMLDFWWQCCLSHGTYKEAPVCESYLLAKLFPETRSTGSRRVLLDSIPRRGTQNDRRAAIANLENLLSKSYDREMTILKFSLGTGCILGRPDYENEVGDLCSEFTNDLFSSAVPMLMNRQEQKALIVVNDLWETWSKRFGRRGNVDIEKQVMDILSYEARAAVHRCYSHLWDQITNWLRQERQCSIASYVFHRLWHLDLSWPSNEDNRTRFHLFHGHILGLHPAAGLFASTITGKRLLGEWLEVTVPGWENSDNLETPEFRRLLHGLFFAMTEYSDRHGNARIRRQPQPKTMPSDFCFSDIIECEDGISAVSRRNKRKSLAE